MHDPGSSEQNNVINTIDSKPSKHGKRFMRTEVSHFSSLLLLLGSTSISVMKQSDH